MSAPSCILCGDDVTAKDPERYPYCRTCHYTGAASAHIRAEQIARFNRLLPGATCDIEHTGGGCFWLACRWQGEAKYYVLTDGDASLPSDPDADDAAIPNGGWGYVGRHDDEDSEENPDFEGTPLHYSYEDLLSDEQAAERILAARAEAQA